MLPVIACVLGLVAGIAAAFQRERRQMRHAHRAALRRVSDETQGFLVRRRERDEALIAERKGSLEVQREAAQRRVAEGTERIARREREYETYGQQVETREQAYAKAREGLESLEGGVREAQASVAKARQDAREALLVACDTTEEAVRAQHLTEVESSAVLEEAKRSDLRLAFWESEVDAEARDVVRRIVDRIDNDFAEETRPFVVPVEQCGEVIAADTALLARLGERTGTEVELDRERGSLIVHGQDGVQREVARRTLSKIGKRERAPGSRRGGRRRGGGGGGGGEGAGGGGGRDLDSTLSAASQAVEADIARAIQWVVRHLRLRPVHPEIQKAMGRLLYRTSHGQNVLGHSYEVGHIGGMLASELGLEPEQGRRCAFLHDIGKAIDVGGEGGHTTLGMEFAKRYGETDPVLNAIESHHDDVPKTSLYPIVASVADAISGARPGARRETSAMFSERVETLEEIAKTKPGVTSAYAVYAGRELRVVVDPDAVNDEGLDTLGDRIAREIEERVGGLGCDILLQRDRRVIEKAR